MFFPRYYGLLPLFAFYGLPLYAYVRFRNSRVAEFSKVMTRRHLVAMAFRQLSWLGIRVQMPGFQEAAIGGTNLRFLGKSDDRTQGVSETISRQAENSPELPRRQGSDFAGRPPAKQRHSSGTQRRRIGRAVSD